MKRRDFITLLGGAAVARPLAARAQQPSKIYRVGVLTPLDPLPESGVIGSALIRGLARRGEELGKNLILERRGAQFHIERLPALVDELVASKVDVMLTLSYPAALAAKERAGAIPIVVFGAGDPVRTGMVESLSRPGGNITGLSELGAELSAKRLEVLKEVAPGLKRVAMLWNADDLGMTIRYQSAAAAAQQLGVVVQPLGVREPNDFDQAFAAMTRELPDAILMVSDALTRLNRKRVYEFAAAHRLPAIFEYDEYVRDGGLLSYGPDQGEMADRAAELLHRILKGAKPAELPLEQPTRFRLMVNLKTAKALGLTIPPALLARADEVIE
jgi:putative tryptophan/tyrosine transport system substrate-binding protein